MAEDPAFRRRGYVALGMLFVVNMFSYMDRSLMPALAEPIKREFALSDSRLGLLTGFSFALLYSLVGLPVARWADRGRRVDILVISVALWSVMTTLTGWTRTFPQLLLARVGVGVGESGCLATAYSLLSDYFPPHRRSFAMGIFLAGNTVGIIAGYALGGWLGATMGWRFAFIVVGAPGLLLALFLWLIVKEPPRGAAEPGGAGRTMQVARELLANKAYMWLAVGTMVMSMISSGVTLWIPAFLMRVHHVDLKKVGAVFGLAFGGGFSIGLICGGYLGDRLARRSLARPPLLSLWLAPFWLAAHLVIFWTPSVTMAFAAVFVASILTGLQSPIWITGMQNVCRPRIRATASAVSTLLNNLIGIGLIALLIGVMSDAFAPRFGDQSLRYALTIILVVIPLFGWMGLRASRSIARTTV